MIDYFTGWTPLHNAANAGQYELVQLLLSHQADPDTHEPLQGNATHCLHMKNIHTNQHCSCEISLTLLLLKKLDKGNKCCNF